MRYGYIYKTINSVNNRIYVGQKKGKFNPNYFGSGIILKQAINKYGKDKFKLEVVVYAEDKDKLNELEKQYISEYRKKFGKLYNITDGGDGGCGSLSPEHIEKLRMSNLGKKRSAETREKLRLVQLGRKHSPEHIEKMRLTKIGKKQSVESNRKRSLTLIGRKLSLEHCKNISLGKKGKKLPEEFRKKMFGNKNGCGKRSAEVRMRYSGQNNPMSSTNIKIRQLKEVSI